MKKLFLIGAVVVLFLACSKDKFQTKPQISIKAYSNKSREVTPNQNLDITFSYTDKEGDIGTGRLLYYPTRLNIIPLANGDKYLDSVIYQIPDLPDYDKGDINFAMRWNDFHKSDTENDTLLIKFQVEDRAGNRSDTISSDVLVVLKQ